MTITMDRANAVTTMRQCETLVRSAAKEYRDGSAKIDAIHGGRTLAAAYATHAAIRVGYLSTGRDVPNGAVNATDYAVTFGVSSALVTAWRKMARVFVDLGLNPESDAGRAVIAGRINVVSKEALASATPDTVEQVIGDALKAEGFLPDGKRDPNAPKKTRAANGNATSGEASDATPVAPRNNSGRIDAIEALCAAMSKNPSKAERDRLAALFGAWSVTWGLVPEGFAPVENAEQSAA